MIIALALLLSPEPLALLPLSAYHQGRGGYSMNRQEIEKYLRMLGEELNKRQTTGESILAGGAVMVLVLQSRAGTLDIDATC